jgi:hypothetical protein
MQKVLSDIETKKNNAKSNLGSYYPCFYNWLGDSNTYNEVNGYLSSSDATINEALSYYFSKYGDVPYANTDNCAGYSPIIYKLLTTVRYYTRFGKLDFNDSKNCEKLKALTFSLENEKLNIDKQFVADQNSYLHNASIEAINNIQNDLFVSYANLNCDVVIYNQQQQQQIDIINETADSGTQESKTSNVGIYVVYGVAVIIIGVVVKKLFFKSK